MTDHRNCNDEAAAYALGALDPVEARSFAAHLETCVICRDEVSAFRGVVASLPLSAPQFAAPSGLKRRVMGEVRTDVRQARRAAPRRSGSRIGAPAWLPRPAFGAAALALTVVLALALVELIPGGSSSRSIQANVAWRGSAVLHVGSGTSELIVRRMPQPPAGRVYEVWLKRGSQAPSPTSALFDVGASGAATVAVPGDLRGVTRVLVTAERSGGSAVPTRQPVIVAQLS